MDDISTTNSKTAQNEISQKRKQQQLDKLQERLQESTTQKINLKKKLENKEKEYEELMTECQSKFQLEQLQILRIMQLIEDEDRFRLSINRNSQLGAQGGESSVDMTAMQTNQQNLNQEIEINDQQLSQLKKELFKLQDQLKDKTSQIETSQSLLDEIKTKKEHLKILKVEKEQMKNDIQELNETLENVKENINEINQMDNHKSISQKICDENENKIELMENELESIIIKLKIKYQNIFNNTEQQSSEQQNINIEEVLQQREKELSLDIEKLKKQITDQGEKELKNLEYMNKTKLEIFQDEKAEQIHAVENKIKAAKQQNSNLQGELIGIENLEQKIQEKHNQCKIMKEKWCKDQEQFTQLSDQSAKLEKSIVEIQKTINSLKQK